MSNYDYIRRFLFYADFTYSLVIIISNYPLLILQTLLDSLGVSFITRLVEQGEHILLICLYTWLVEWIYTQYVAADTAGNFEEVNELSDIVAFSSGTEIRILGTPPST